MVSSKTLEIFGTLIQVGNWIKLIPAVMNLTENRIQLIDSKYRIRFPCLQSTGVVIQLPEIYFLIQASNIAYLLLFLTCAEYSHLDMCFTIFLLVCFYMSISTQIVLLFQFDDVCTVVNAFHDLDLKLRKLHLHCITDSK